MYVPTVLNNHAMSTSTTTGDSEQHKKYNIHNNQQQHKQHNDANTEKNQHIKMRNNQQKQK
jgi:hypothetical protein